MASDLHTLHVFYTVHCVALTPWEAPLPCVCVSVCVCLCVRACVRACVPCNYRHKATSRRSPLCLGYFTDGLCLSWSCLWTCSTHSVGSVSTPINIKWNYFPSNIPRLPKQHCFGGGGVVRFPGLVHIEYSERILAQCHNIHHESHMVWLWNRNRASAVRWTWSVFKYSARTAQ